jgi:hypothetical protein
MSTGMVLQPKEPIDLARNHPVTHVANGALSQTSKSSTAAANTFELRKNQRSLHHLLQRSDRNHTPARYVNNSIRFSTQHR